MKAQAGNSGVGRGGKKKPSRVGNVSSQAGGKRSMGGRNGAPAATADGYARVVKAAKRAAKKAR